MANSRKIKVQEIEANIFKFCFELVEDKAYIFDKRPWSFNRALLVLREWNPSQALNELSFDSIAFFVQIHGLPPKLLHPKNGAKIGSQLGKVYKDSIHKRAVVGGKFLRLRIEIPIDTPLSAGFFYKKDTGEQIWIHFKYERLMDFCFTCGLLTHVTGRCNFKDPAKITAISGITTRLYGPWLRANNKSFLQFLNNQGNLGKESRATTTKELPEKTILNDDSRADKEIQILKQSTKGAIVSFKNALVSALYKGQMDQVKIPMVDVEEVVQQFGETLEDLQAIVSAELVQASNHWSSLEERLWKDDRLELLTNLAEMSLATAALGLTLKMGPFDIAPSIILTFVNYAEKVEYKADLVYQWATKALNLLKENKA